MSIYFSKNTKTAECRCNNLCDIAIPLNTIYVSGLRVFAMLILSECLLRIYLEENLRML